MRNSHDALSSTTVLFLVPLTRSTVEHHQQDPKHPPHPATAELFMAE